MAVVATPGMLVALTGSANLVVELIKQLKQRRQCGIPLCHRTDVAEKSGRVFQVGRLSIAIAYARKNTKHFQVTLQTHPFELSIEFAKVGAHWQACPARLLPIAHDPVKDVIPAYAGIQLTHG